MQNLHQRLLTFTGDGIYRYTFDESRILLANQGLVRILDLECKPEELVGKRLDDVLIDAEQPGQIRDYLRSAGEIHGLDWHFKTLKGDNRWVIHDSFLVKEPRTGQRVVEAVIKDVTDRKRVEEALRESHRVLQAVIESSTDMIFMKDLQGRYVFLNAAAAHAVGKPAAEAIGKDDDALFPPDVAAQVRESDRRVIASGESLRYEETFSSPRMPRTMVTAKSPCREAGGKVIGVVGIARDITERKRMEEALQAAKDKLEQLAQERTAELGRTDNTLQAEMAAHEQSDAARLATEGKYRELVENVNSIILRRDTEGRITYMNPFGLRFFGWTEEDILGRHVVGTIVPEKDRSGRDLAAMIRDINREPERHESNENENMRRNGERVWITWSNRPIRDKEGKVIEILAVGNDITAHRLADEERMLFAAIVENSRSFIAATSPAGDVFYLNAAGLGMAGLDSPQEARSCNVFDQLTDLSEETVLSFIRSGGHWEGECRIRQRGTGKDLEAHGAVFAVNLSLSDEPECLAVNLRDMTERKRLQRKILAVAAEECHRIGSDLHDTLGQNLTGAAMLTDALARKLAEKSRPEAPEAALVAGIILETTRQVQQLAKGLCPVEASPEGLAAALEGLASSASSLFGISCRFRCKRPVLVHDRSVAEHLYHIAQEAVTNAVKHGRAKQVVISLQQEGGGVTLSVTDNGRGFQPEASQPDGLGLRIMEYRASMMGGKIETGNGPKGGAFVTCTASWGT